MRLDAAIVAAAGFGVCALTASVIEAQPTPPPLRLCPDDGRRSSTPLVSNDDRRTVGDILRISPAAIELQYRSPDWSGPDAIAQRVREILDSRPRFLSPFLNWSEGPNLALEGFVATVRMADGATARMDVAGYQVCIRDAKGTHWYLRTVPGDQWPGAEGQR